MKLQEFIKRKRNGNMEFDDLMAKNEDIVIASYRIGDRRWSQHVIHYFACFIDGKLRCFKRQSPCGGFMYLYPYHVDEISVMDFYKHKSDNTKNTYKEDMLRSNILKEEILAELI